MSKQYSVTVGSMNNQTDNPSVNSVKHWAIANGQLRTGIQGDLGSIAVHRKDNVPKLIVHSRIYHRDKDGNVKGTLCRFLRSLTCTDDVFMRKMTIGEMWVELDLGWIQDIGYLSIQNHGGKRFNVVPNQEQLQEEQSRIIEIGYMVQSLTKESIDITQQTSLNRIKKTNKRTHFDPPLIKDDQLISPIMPLWLIRPGGEGIQGTPVSEEPMYLRCRHGEVTISIMCHPN